MPYLIAIFIAIGIFKRSSAMDILTNMCSPLTKLIGMPKELLPLIVMKPISGSGSLALVKNITQTYGADSFIARVAGTMMGSAETIFYTMAVYFGAVGIKNTRHTLKAAMVSHLGAVVASLVICNMLFK
ncbi:nucleoside recognition domain-containing protein [Clostridiaceae bacterium M8S5]|nr:nucleoside recognition domain-containing protein [Clostridiaceae bacterium M8S5]